MKQAPESERSCESCGAPLKASEARNHQKRCGQCLAKRSIVTRLSQQGMDTTFARRWVKDLFHRLGTFLAAREIPLLAQERLLQAATRLLHQAEMRFASQEEIEESWIASMIEQERGRCATTYLCAFLRQEHLLREEDRDEKIIRAVQAKVTALPLAYRRVVEVFVNERLSWRERQIRQNARHPLAARTLQTDVEVLSRLVRWLTTVEPALSGWEAVQEQHIHAFLLTLTPNNRELVRKDLQVFFRLARKRRLITHVPLMDAPTKAMPLSMEPLREDEQRALARRIREGSALYPEEALLTALCFYHGLSSAQIRHMKRASVDLEHARILLEARPPVYLLAEDCRLLEQFLKKRQTLPYAKSRTYLFMSNQATLDDRPVAASTVCSKVRTFTSYTPQCLRITCLAALSTRYGPQYLVEACGVSLTQAARYGNMREFLLEEELKEQQEQWKEWTRRLEKTRTEGTENYEEPE